MSESSGPSALHIERLVAPGTRLREAVDLVLQQDSGALVVLGDRDEVNGICSGGFDLDGAVFTPQRLAELAKMDGAIVLDSDARYILKSNVHLIPDPSIATDETGTRHRTAERVARQTGLPVVSVSEGRGKATVFYGEGKYELQTPTSLLAHANQSIQSLERFRRRFDDAEEQLTRAEVDDVATVRDVVLPLQRAALVVRLGADLERVAVELGREGDLIRLQLADLTEGIEAAADLIYNDYARKRSRRGNQLDRLDTVATDGLYDISKVGAALGLGSLDSHARPQGYRILNRVPRLPDSVKDALVDHFGGFQKLIHATVSELDQVEGVGSTRAHHLRHYFDQLLAASPLWEVGEL